MANSTESTNYAIDFMDTFNDLAQEKTAKLVASGVVSMESINGEQKAIDQVGTTKAREITGKVVKVQFDEIEHLRRALRTKRYVLTIPVDKASVQDLARDPSGKYAEQCVAAFNRLKDQIVVTAATADVFTGEDFSTTVDFATDGGRTVDATATGLTYEKIREIKSKQTAVATGSDNGEMAVLAITESEQDDMLAETELTSGDFDRLQTIDGNGSIVKALGINIVQFASETADPTLKVSGGVRDCIAFAGDSVALGVHTEPNVEIKDISDQYYETNAVFITARMGAVRREGVRILKVQTTA